MRLRAAFFGDMARDAEGGDRTMCLRAALFGDLRAAFLGDLRAAFFGDLRDGGDATTRGILFCLFVCDVVFFLHACLGFFLCVCTSPKG